MMAKSVIGEARDIALASELIKLGARLQVLESETKLSREKLLRLYKEIQGKSPPKGMLPFSTDWFMTWQPNIHSSLFISIYRYIDKSVELEQIEAVVKAYRLYREHVRAHNMEDVLSITRAWRLIKFFDAGMLTTTCCKDCGGHFVTHSFELTDNYVCGLCNVPSRAGKTKKRAEAEREAV
ncbi:MAG TPA: flagellar transcriptional regulator FlhC [Burkholderiales bacterium]|nr:flagellar transcriptional regulator FlhC [Burkholderiales bacterium]